MSLARQFRKVDTPQAMPKPKAPEPDPSADAPKKRGPKPSPNSKVLLTIRLNPATIAKFKATGPGWQARMSDALDKAMV